MLFDVIKYLIYLFIEINNKFKYIYNCVHVRMGYVTGSKANTWLNDTPLKRANGVGTFGKRYKKKRWSCLVLSVIGGIVISYTMNLAQGEQSLFL
jgi:hypothetical protein